MLEAIFKRAYLIVIGIIVLVLLILVLMSTKIISTGEVGVRTRLGKAIGLDDPGFHVLIPFMDSVKVMETREQTVEKTYSVSSKDMQTIQMTLNVQYSIGSDVLELYQKFGTSYKERLIEPRIAETLNAVSAQYTIEEFITKRNEMAQRLLDEIMVDFKDYGVIVAACSIIDHDFSDQFDQAIERKLVASQDALTALNELEKVKANAEAEITKAKASAEANKYMQQSITPLLIQKMYIEKWDGKLPQIQSGNGIMPMINLK